MGDAFCGAAVPKPLTYFSAVQTPPTPSQARDRPSFCDIGGDVFCNGILGGEEGIALGERVSECQNTPLMPIHAPPARGATTGLRDTCGSLVALGSVRQSSTICSTGVRWKATPKPRAPKMAT